MSAVAPPRVGKVLIQPINVIFRYLQNRDRVLIWLHENVNEKIEGQIIGFDEYMNLVIEDAYEIHQKNKTRTKIGRMLLRGENIAVVQNLNEK